ncbi:hypothetical protein [Acetohalobium arabaticum]|uniref:Uncharacterized protein n=1 Tax=Acetohalobium arabaticum (strain ATCC 49924 / DSM 5501 / Z-7288) TaxID=574087 RepID=D9QQ43_ACEAZ|nr:hypothetical protein [Acetohalobium arabaticum]ADL12634.1 hypothetical protein Acear_1111 [Acetohalobium arabaticum DSM 5501]
MEFKDKLIQRLKEDPDVFNEIRSEIIASDFNREKKEKIGFIDKPEESNFLEERSDEKLIEAIAANLEYFIEYSKENEERWV